MEMKRASWKGLRDGLGDATIAATTAAVAAATIAATTTLPTPTFYRQLFVAAFLWVLAVWAPFATRRM